MAPTRSSLTPTLVALICGLLTGTAVADRNSYAQISKGRYLARVGDCVACHSAPDGEYLAGGKAIPTPFGEIYSANITPDEETGLGNWNQDQFIRAMRHGVSADGSHLYPAFPYPSFTRVTDQDLAAIWSYLKTIDPVHKRIREPDIYWPLNWRTLMIGWKTLFFEPGVHQPDPEKSEQWNRGAYLVEGLGHCGSCHTPKNLFGAADSDEAYQGFELQQWFAPKLTSDPKDGLGDWSNQDIVDYLKTGTNGDQVAAGLMREVVEKSTQHMTEEDLHAIATYLKDLPGDDHAGDDGNEADTSTDRNAERNELGRALYVDHCTACHRYDGTGMQDTFPALRDSPIVQSDNPTSLVHVVLRGARSPSTEQRANLLAMPDFAWKLTDEQVAAVLTYIRGAWGNNAAPVDSGKVEEVRAATGLEPEPVAPE